MRGNHPDEFGNRLYGGSIPAGAGEPSQQQQPNHPCAVYPRGCGGTLCALAEPLDAVGLSPRVRGNLFHHPRNALSHRSIPAGAGEPVRVALSAFAVQVYPRGCGGTNPDSVTLVITPGLSPRVRGNQIEAAHHFVYAGSIPAGAGEPARPCPPQTARTVYPRGCGGTDHHESSSLYASGLSPRVRGNLLCRKMCSLCMGSIPAGAGEPSTITARLAGGRVYPRGCGGTNNKPMASHIRRGLSPRVRGNRAAGPHQVHPDRSIPAGAGEPRTSGLSRSPCRVYPRGCGGTNTTPTNRIISIGLSPRVRGNP